MDGFSIAFNEITLVLFTTLAPAGAVGYLLMSLPVLLGRVSEDDRRRLDQYSCLPLAIAMVGLIASATHLGNPSNALYVFTGVGRSPLSTEVLCAVIFLALAGMYWLYAFAEHPRRWLQRGLVAAVDLSIVLFVVSIAFAYHVDTIITWSLPLVPVSLMLNALVGGPVITLLGFAAAGYCGHGPGEGRLLVAMAAVALAANAVVYLVMGAQLSGMANELASVSQLVPGFVPCVVAFVLLAATGLTVAWRSVCRGLAMRPLVVASLLVLAGIFIMRFTFYMSHLTVGLGV